MELVRRVELLLTKAGNLCFAIIEKGTCVFFCKDVDTSHKFGLSHMESAAINGPPSLGMFYGGSSKNSDMAYKTVFCVSKKIASVVYEKHPSSNQERCTASWNTADRDIIAFLGMKSQAEMTAMYKHEGL